MKKVVHFKVPARPEGSGEAAQGTPSGTTASPAADQGQPRSLARETEPFFRPGATPFGQAWRGFDAFGRCGWAVALGLQQVGQECLAIAGEEPLRQWASLSRLAGCRSPQDWFEARLDMARGNLGQALAYAERMARVSGSVAGEAARTMTGAEESWVVRAAPETV